MCHGAAAYVEKRQTDASQQASVSQQTGVPQQTDQMGLPQQTNMPQQVDIPQQTDMNAQADMMELVPVALDMVSPGHTNEPQLRTWEMFFWGPDREFAPLEGTP